GRLLRLDARLVDARADDDDAGSGPVLRRHEPLEVRAQHDDDVVLGAGRGRHRLRPLGLVDVLQHHDRRRRGQHRRRGAPAVLEPLQPVRAQQHRPAQLRLRGVPADLRGDHRRADQRRHRRPGQVLCVAGVPAAVGHAVVLPARPHGLGRRVPQRCPERSRRPAVQRRRGRGGRADRLRRRHRGPHQCRDRGAGAGAPHRQAARLRQGADEAPQPHADDDRRRPAVVRLVRLQRRLDRLHRRGRGRQRRPVHDRDRPGLAQHHAGHLRGHDGLAGPGEAPRRQGHVAGRRLGRRRRARRDHPCVRRAVAAGLDAARSGRGHAVRAGGGSQAPLRLRRLPGRRRGPPRGWARRHGRHRVPQHRDRSAVRRGRQAAGRAGRGGAVRDALVRSGHAPGGGAHQGHPGLARGRRGRGRGCRLHRARGGGLRPHPAWRRRHPATGYGAVRRQRAQQRARQHCRQHARQHCRQPGGRRHCHGDRDDQGRITGM
ncbi:MAG: Ammonium transporter, partial [uncultured Nocardioidaceae bacterium]